MKELTVQYIPPQGRRRPRVRVEYTSEIGAQRQAQEAAFRFSTTDDERRLIQWYLEDYLTYPWGEFQNRAQRAEALMERLGKELFDVVFGTREIGTLYSHVADDLSNTRIIIHAADQEGIALPWELMRDSTLGAYGYLARLAHAFVRSQPDLKFQPPQTPSGDTFNILMVICRPGGPRGDVAFQSVARPLLELLRPYRDHVRLDILRPPTLAGISRSSSFPRTCDPLCWLTGIAFPPIL